MQAYGDVLLHFWIRQEIGQGTENMNVDLKPGSKTYYVWAWAYHLISTVLIYKMEMIVVLSM